MWKMFHLQVLIPWIKSEESRMKQLKHPLNEISNFHVQNALEVTYLNDGATLHKEGSIYSNVAVTLIEL